MADEGNWSTEHPEQHALQRAYKRLTLTCSQDHNHELQCYSGTPENIEAVRYCKRKLLAKYAGWDRVVIVPGRRR